MLKIQKYLPKVVKTFFNIDLFKYQIDIINSILSDKKKITIKASTRAGKSYSVALGALIYALTFRNKKVGIIAPTQHKTKIIMGYIGEFLSLAPELTPMLDLDINGKDIRRLKKETSKQRVTFKNGSSIEVLTADLPSGGQALMGRAYHLTIVDESAEISEEAYSKIYRMLVEDPTAKIVEIYNPWYLNHTYRHCHDPTWEKIHIPWETCVDQGRLRKEDIDDQRNELTDLEFEVLYNANHPEDMEYSVFKQKIHIAPSLEKKTEKIYDKILCGIDVATGGKDFTVITIIGEKDNNFYFLEYKKLDTDETMEIVGQARLLIDKYKEDKRIIVDAIGVGDGVASRFKELNYKTTKFKAGSRAEDKDRYFNIKTETIFGMAKIMKDGRFWNLPENSSYVLELKKWEFEVRSDRLLKTIDPEDKSPDYADSLMLAMAKPSGEITVIETSLI